MTPVQLAPSPTAGAPRGMRVLSIVGSDDTRAISSASAIVTDVTVYWVTTDCTTAGSTLTTPPGPISARTIGVLASCSAIAETRRPSVRVNVDSDCARDTSATVTRTPSRMTICTTSSCPARERRPKRPGLCVTKTNSTFIADTRATRRRGAGHDHAVPATERERDLNDEHSHPRPQVRPARRHRRRHGPGLSACGATAKKDEASTGAAG